MINQIIILLVSCTITSIVTYLMSTRRNKNSEKHIEDLMPKYKCPPPPHPLKERTEISQLTKGQVSAIIERYDKKNDIRYLYLSNVKKEIKTLKENNEIDKNTSFKGTFKEFNKWVKSMSVDEFIRQTTVIERCLSSILRILTLDYSLNKKDIEKLPKVDVNKVRKSNEGVHQPNKDETTKPPKGYVKNPDGYVSLIIDYSHKWRKSPDISKQRTCTILNFKSSYIKMNEIIDKLTGGRDISIHINKIQQIN